jgi:hypothetical protein
MPTYQKPVTLGDVVKREVDPALSRENVILAAGKVYPIGSVLGRLRVDGVVTVGAAAAAAGNTGNGTLTPDATPNTAEVREGTYRVIFTSATKANVENPDGEIIGVATVGTLFNKELRFTLAAGGTAFVAGDSFTIAVAIAANDGACDQWDPTVRSGLEEVYGVLLWEVDTTGGALTSVALARGPSMVSRDALAFKAGTTTAQKADAFKALSEKGISVRETI